MSIFECLALFADVIQNSKLTLPYNNLPSHMSYTSNYISLPFIVNFIYPTLGSVNVSY